MVYNFGNPYPPSVGSFQVPVLPPDVDPDEGDQVLVCFSTAWLPLVVGALQQLTLQATWKGDDDTVLLAQMRAMMLIEHVNLGTLPCPQFLVITDVRYDAESDEVQRTFDGGSTWVNEPGLDPRHADIFRFPPVEADDPRCQAAANMSRYLENVIDSTLTNLAIGSDVADLVLVLTPLFVELGPFAILVDLITALALTLVSAGATAISAAFTADVYDTLTCIFFCRIETDGSVTADELADIESDVSSLIGGLVSVVLSAMFFLTGEVGLSNQGTLGAAPADCDDCECEHCFELDFTVSDGTGFGYTNQGGTWASGTGWTGIFDTSASKSDVTGYWAFGETLSATKIQLDYTKENGSGGNNVNRFHALKPATSYNTTSIALNSDNSLGVNLTKEIDVSDDLDGMGFDINSGGDDGPCSVLRLRVHYRGSIPDGWSDNC